MLLDFILFKHSGGLSFLVWTCVKLNPLNGGPESEGVWLNLKLGLARYSKSCDYNLLVIEYGYIPKKKNRRKKKKFLSALNRFWK